MGCMNEFKEVVVFRRTWRVCWSDDGSMFFLFLCCACSAGAAEQASGSAGACRGSRLRNGMTKAISGRWCIRTHNHDDGTHQKWQGFHHRTSNVRVVTSLDRSCQKWEHQKCRHGQTRIHEVVKPTVVEFHTSIKVLEFKDENGISWVSLNLLRTTNHNGCIRFNLKFINIMIHHVLTFMKCNNLNLQLVYTFVNQTLIW